MNFKEINADEVRLLSEALARDIRADVDEIFELIESFSDSDGDVEFAAAAAHGCIIIRIFDMGRYIFSYPYAMTDGASLDSAIEEIARYTQREELPLVLSDVPRDEITTVLSLGFRHIELDTEDDAGETYRVRIISECEMLEDIPTVYDADLSLGALCEDDIEAYAEISREESGLRYWGYDYRDDMPDAEDEYFYATANRDFMAGVSMTLAMRLAGALIGEVQIYAFDRRGGADFALRLLPSSRGKGIGKRALRLVFDAAGEIGLSRLYCDVMTENKPSVAFVSSAMEIVSQNDNVVRFKIEL